jgi:hypothetical protein
MQLIEIELWRGGKGDSSQTVSSQLFRVTSPTFRLLQGTPLMEYFQNFQAYHYGNTNAMNIMERCAILNSIFKNVYTFYPYQVKTE